MWLLVNCWRLFCMQSTWGFHHRSYRQHPLKFLALVMAAVVVYLSVARSMYLQSSVDLTSTSCSTILITGKIYDNNNNNTPSQLLVMHLYTLTFVLTTKFFTPSTYFDPVLTTWCSWKRWTHQAMLVNDCKNADTPSPNFHFTTKIGTLLNFVGTNTHYSHAYCHCTMVCPHSRSSTYFHFLR